MIKLGKSLLLIAGVIFFASCSTDFDVNADWQDQTVVYALLDQDDTAHYVRINRAFLGSEDAYVMASYDDSVQYEGTLTASLEEWKNGSKVAVFPLTKVVNEIPKDEGIFGNGTNVLYKSTANLDVTSEYRLSIAFPESGKEVTSSTNLITGLGLGNFGSPQFPMILSDVTEVEIYSAKNAIIYDVTVRFHYYETTDGTNYVEDSIDWTIPSKYASSPDGGEKIVLLFNSRSFRNLLANQLENNPDIRRAARSTRYDFINGSNSGAIDLHFSMGGEELYTYIQVNQPYDGIVQERPAYTNINGGIGVFSCRNTKKVYGKELAPSSLDSLSRSEITKELNFMDQNGKYWWETD